MGEPKPRKKVLPKELLEKLAKKPAKPAKVRPLAFEAPPELIKLKQHIIKNILGGPKEWAKASREGKKSKLLDLANIVGIYIGQKRSKGKPTPVMAVVVEVLKKTDKAKIHRDFLIKEKYLINGKYYYTDIRVGNKVKAQAGSVQGGDFCALKDGAVQGTIACCCAVKFDGDTEATSCMLSNNHVFGKLQGASPTKKTIISPDTGATIGEYKASSSSNQVDGAIAEAFDNVSALHRGFDIGSIFSRQVSEHEKVKTFGAKTASLQDGVVESITWSGPIDYENGTVTLEDQIKIVHVNGSGQAFSQSGDSGSLIVDAEFVPVGLLVGGPNSAPFFTVACHLHRVEKELGIVGYQTHD